MNGLNADFARLRANPQAWEEEQAEREAWETTLHDDLAVTDDGQTAPRGSLDDRPRSNARPRAGRQEAGPGRLRQPLNAGPAGLVIILPVTSKEKGVRSHVPVEPPEGGLRTRSFVKCEDVRSVAAERLGKRLGRVSPATMHAVADRLRILMEL